MTNEATRYQAFFDQPDTFVVPDDHAMFLGAHVARYRFAAALAGGKHVIDVGCGSGYGTALLNGVAARAVGIDGSRRALGIAKRVDSGRRPSFVRMDARSMGIAANSFDLATCFEVIEHVDAPVADEIVGEVLRCLKRDGVALFSTPNHAVVTQAGVHVPDFHINNLNINEFRSLLAAHFSHVEMWGQTLTGNMLYRLIRGIDMFGLRQKLYRALGERTQRRAYGVMGVSTAQHQTADNYKFSRWFVRRAGILLAVCRK